MPGQWEHPWVGPDILVAARPPRDPLPRVWVVWEDGPLQFVAEVASDRTRGGERKKREEIYEEALSVPEYLYVDLDRRQLELWRVGAGKYHHVREQEGRFFSRELGVWFGWGPAGEFVRIWTAAGRMLPTPQEREQQLQEEQRLRREAEARAKALAAELERLRGDGA